MLQNFRCFEQAELAFHPEFNAFVGENGSGKSSVLEAIYFLGRGRSFRAGDSRVLIQSGRLDAELAGSVLSIAGTTRLRVGIRPSGLAIQIDGSTVEGASELVSRLPIQAIPADIGNAIQGPPEIRRRMLDWGVFHVEHPFLVRWREFRRTLLQRNAALRAGSAGLELDVWDEKLASAGLAIDELRKAYLARLRPCFRTVTAELLDVEAELAYKPGWPAGQALLDSLRASRESDREMGYTRVGPHRADLQIEIGQATSRWRASRGQQKLLGAALVLAVCRIARSSQSQPLALIVDEPAADLDADHLRRLLNCLRGTDAQLFVAAITIDGLALPSGKMMFHVEHGGPKALL